MEILFHITEEENLSSILERGLLPKIGRNSSMIWEDTPRVFLSDLESLPYWIILLGVKHPVIFSVFVDKEPEFFNYCYYKEYYSYTPISPSKLSIVSNVDSDCIHAAMVKLCEGYVDWICNYCVRLLHHYEHNIPVEQVYDARIDIQFDIIKRLDYSCRTQLEWRKYIKSIGERGKYTFFDEFAVVGKPPKMPIWKKLLTYPEDKLSHTRCLISEFIQSKFPDCLDMTTGGWTG